jgi:S-adenosylmethionine hydrolase
MSIITLTTDFGLADGYGGVMKGVILARAPEARLVDLSHEIAPQDVAAGAYILLQAYRYFPPETIHLAVVDPGVGTARRALLLVTEQGRFVGPDNGLFSHVLREAAALAAGWTGMPATVPAVWHPAFDLAAVLRSTPPARLPRAYTLTNPAYWLAGASATFHGRDLFAPVAAHLASGVLPARLGDPVPLESLILLPSLAPALAPGLIEGRVIACDHFGNLISNIEAGLLATLGPMEAVQVTLGPHHLQGIQPTYGATLPGAPLALINSAGLLEIAVRDGHAAQQLGGRVGDAVICQQSSAVEG